MSLLRSRAGAASAVLGLRLIVSSVTTLASSLILLRLLGSEEWGVFTIPFLSVQAVAELTQRGFGARLIQNRLQPGKRRIEAAAGGQAALAVIGALGALAVGSGAAIAYREDRMFALACSSSLASFLIALRAVPVHILERRYDYWRVGFIELLDSVVFAIPSVILVLVFQNVLVLAIPLILRGLLPTILAYRYVPGAGQIRLTRKLILHSWPFAKAMLSISVLGIAIRFVPAAALIPTGDLAALAEIEVARSLFTNLFVLVQVTHRVGFVALSEISARGDPSEAASSLALVQARMVSPMMLMAVGMAPLAIPGVLGPSWNATLAYFLVISPSFLFISAFWPIAVALASATGRPEIISRAMISYIVCSFVGGVLLSFVWPGGALLAMTLSTPILYIMVQRGLRIANIRLDDSRAWRVLFGTLAVGAVLVLVGLLNPLVGATCTLGVTCVWIAAELGLVRRHLRSQATVTELEWALERPNDGG